MKLSFFVIGKATNRKFWILLSSNFHSTLPIWQPSFFHFHGGPLIFENVNMTHQLEIWHSEESERIWASFRRFGTHYFLIKWAQRYYDDTINIYMASTNSSSNLKLIFLIMSIIEAEFLSQHCLWESQQSMAVPVFYFWFCLINIFFLWLM